MTVNKSSFYAQWRSRPHAGSLLREDRGTPSEKLLQAIWMHQRLQREKLVTLDGKTVEVLHPGFWNREPGPDFRGAILRIGGELSRGGDVEVDLDSNGWKSHGHDINPAFGKVTLHVVWSGDGRSKLPTLAIRGVLDAPVDELMLWLGGEGAEPPALPGQCSAPLKGLGDKDLTELLNQAAFVRLESKAKQFQSRARHAGWEQALWEGLFRALGYKHNVWPMQRLAELRPLIAAGGANALALQARLLGVSGLLPEDLTAVHASAKSYVRQLWDCWWRERDAWSESLLPKSLWRFSGLRPANQPQRRLALAAHWLTKRNLAKDLETWCASKVAEPKLVESLLKVLQAEDEFWNCRWTWRTGRLKTPQPLLGPSRLTDLAVNVVLPWLWSRAIEGSNAEMRNEIERCYFAWPAGEDNVVLRLARRRLLENSSERLPAKAAAQQGLLQIVRDFCERSNALCEQCRFPELVRAWPG